MNGAFPFCTWEKEKSERKARRRMSWVNTQTGVTDGVGVQR